MNSKKIFDAYNLLLESDDIERLKKIIVRYELFKKSLKITGDIIECGVFKGTGHIFWLKLLGNNDPKPEEVLKKIFTIDLEKNKPPTKTEKAQKLVLQKLIQEKANQYNLTIEVMASSKSLLKYIRGDRTVMFCQGWRYQRLIYGRLHSRAARCLAYNSVTQSIPKQLIRAMLEILVNIMTLWSITVSVGSMCSAAVWRFIH